MREQTSAKLWPPVVPLLLIIDMSKLKVMKKNITIIIIITFIMVMVFSKTSLAQTVGNYLYLNGNVGIGTSNPQKKLDVTGDTNITGNLTVSGTITNSAIQSKPWFIATVSGGWISGPFATWDPIIFNTVSAGNSGGWFSTSTGKFSAPQTGLYYCYFNGYGYNGSSSNPYAYTDFACNGVVGHCGGRVTENIQAAGSSYWNPSINELLNLNSGDTVIPYMFSQAISNPPTNTMSYLTYAPESRFGCAYISN